MADAFNTEAFTLLGVGLFIVGLRTFARIKSTSIRGLAVDDYLMLVAAVRANSFMDRVNTYVLQLTYCPTAYLWPRDWSCLFCGRPFQRAGEQ